MPPSRLSDSETAPLARSPPDHHFIDRQPINRSPDTTRLTSSLKCLLATHLPFLHSIDQIIPEGIIAYTSQVLARRLGEHRFGNMISALKEHFGCVS